MSREIASPCHKNGSEHKNMPDPDKKDPVTPDQGGERLTTVDPQQFSKLQQQVEQLNQGIAAERAARKKVEADLEAERTSKATKTDSKPDVEDVDLAPDKQKELEAWAKQQGFVRQQDIEAEKAKQLADQMKAFEKQAIDEFLAKFPEYEEEQNWTKVEQAFQDYKVPTTLQGFRTILGKIHKDLGGKDGEEAEAKAKAKIENKSRLSLGGGSQKSSPQEQTVEDLQKRYPNLSREQIEQRLAETNALFPEK